NEVNSKADVANSMFLPLAGGTMTGAINWNSGSPFLQYLGNNRIRFSTNNTILSADAAGTANGGIYLRPQGDAATAGQVVLTADGTLSTANDGNSYEWWRGGNLIGGQIVGTVATTLDAELPKGGFITGYSGSNWAGSDAPTGSSYGGYIKFRRLSSDNNNLDFFYNNGHSGTDSRLWYRTKNSVDGTKPWLEFVTSGNINSYLPTIPTINDYWTTNTNQAGLTGDKTTNGILTFNGTQANSLRVIRNSGLINSSMSFGFQNTDNVWIGAADTGTFAIGLVDANIANTSRQRLYVNATSVGTADISGSYI